MVSATVWKRVPRMWGGVRYQTALRNAEILPAIGVIQIDEDVIVG